MRHGGLRAIGLAVGGSLLGGLVLVGETAGQQSSVQSMPDRSVDGFLLAQASFSGSRPLPSQCTVILRDPILRDSWTTEVFQLEDGSNVFHKAQWFQPAVGDPGVLTISANPPTVRLWRHANGRWSDTLLWEGTVGEAQDRLRDLEIGDVTGDGVEDLVIVTHDRGVVMILEQQEGRYSETRIDQADEPTWIHECELGDLDGDGTLEIVCTPSEPNNMSGAHQAGEIKMFKRAGDEWTASIVERFETRHVKEVLTADLDGDGQLELLASLEGEAIGGAGGASTAIKRYTWNGSKWVGEEIMSLPGQLCRFLACGDTTGDGQNELVAATYKNGVWAVAKKGDAWVKKSVASSLVTSSFEHAIWLADLDDNGMQEIYVAADKQKRLYRFEYDTAQDKYRRFKICDLPGESPLTFNLMPYWKPAQQVSLEANPRSATPVRAAEPTRPTGVSPAFGSGVRQAEQVVATDDTSLVDGGLLLAQASFSGAEPQPSRLVIALKNGDRWDTETITADDGSNVFHKAQWFEPVLGEPGILTISANPAFLKLWRRHESGWTAETLWQGDVGVDQQRLRDLEVGDVTGDGVDDLVIVTHDRGVVMVIEQRNGAYVATRIDEQERPTWIHECELGDIDGDGTFEIFATPSAPNNLSGEEQPGEVRMYRMRDGAFETVVIDRLETRHLKEILATSFQGEASLFGVMEGERIGSDGGAPTQIRRYRQDATGAWLHEDLIDLPDQLCRFLACGDVDGDGREDLVAATYRSGIYCVSCNEAGEWSRRRVASGLVSSSFEHAIWLADDNGDGVLDVLVASDKQKRLQRFAWDADEQKFKRTKLLDLRGDSFLTFNMTALPAAGRRAPGRAP